MDGNSSSVERLAGRKQVLTPDTMATPTVPTVRINAFLSMRTFFCSRSHSPQGP